MTEITLMLENLHFKDINPLICGHENCESAHSFGPYTRDFVLLHYVRSGGGVLYSRGEKHNVHAGQIFVILPNEETTYVADTKTPWKYVWIGFKAGIDLPECLQKPVIDAENCEHIFRSLIAQGENENSNELYVLSKIYELLSILSKPNDSGKSLAQSYVAKAKNYIHSLYFQDISILGIAKHLGLDRSYFSRIFSEIEGMSPSQYLLTIRLQKAAELISGKGFSPAQAAAACGYADTVNFSRMFKRKYNVAPSQYKIKKRNHLDI